MGRILALDYGQKRVGIAVTDENQIIATALPTIPSANIFAWLENYFKNEKVDSVVVGEPRQMNNTASESVKYIEPFINRFRKLFPDMTIHRYDERFTSMMAERAINEAGLGKKMRNNKEMIDAVSAVLILQSFLNSQMNKIV
jgi:putative holliday junction resolvase